MVDLHCHILPAIDDGSTSWEETSEMCRIAAQDGVLHIVATPHANHKYSYDREYFEPMRQRLQATCGHLLNFSLGCDFHLSYENIEDALRHPRRYTIANSNYLLVEFNDFSLMPVIRQGIFRLVSGGIIPIVTHPERNPVLLDRHEKVLELIDCGCLIQVTASSFTGHWGERPQQMAEWLLLRDAVHVVASDAHDTRHRPPVLSAAYERVRILTNKSVAQTLFVDNPGAIVSAEPPIQREVPPPGSPVDR
ncbi:MAG TPA: CpsB/CapC family capsule biosynthesis tyrosine phosphatase [Terriglobales bacterium]